MVMFALCPLGGCMRLGFSEPDVWHDGPHAERRASEHGSTDSPADRTYLPDARRREAGPDGKLKDLSGRDIPHEDRSAPDIKQKDLVAPDIKQKDLAAPDIKQKDLAAPDIKQKDLAVPDKSAEGCVSICAGKCAGAADGCGGTCPSNTCAGCCSSGACLPGTSSSACGLNGAACVGCAVGWWCNAGACACTPSCNGKCNGASDGCGGKCTGKICIGCCDPALSCMLGNSDTACGTFGGACVDCTATALRCVGGFCSL
jgi:hypothetical protein